MAQDISNQPSVLKTFSGLLLPILVGNLVFSVLGIALGVLLFGGSFTNLASAEVNIPFLRVVQIFSSIGMFIFPAWWYAKRSGFRPADFFKLNTPVFFYLFILTALILYFSAPFLQWTIDLNSQLSLPSFLSNLEKWMRHQEDKLTVLTQQFLRMPHWTDLAINLVMIAFLPAIGEELFFRGCLQPIFIRITKNKHTAVWLTAMVFSAIHMQFFGFLPRMLLGALLGYLYVYGKSLWYPIFGHFVNNASAVVATYVFQQRGLSVAQAMKQDAVPRGSFYAFAIILSATITVFLLYRFYQIAKRKGIYK